MNRINRDFRINFCYVKMKKKKKEKRNTRFGIKKRKRFFFEREFFPDISLTDLIKNFGTKKKGRIVVVHVERMEKREGRKESIDHQCVVEIRL